MTELTGLVSFCLFGDDPNNIFFEGAVKHAEQYKKNFPNWELWFYVGRSVPDTVVQKIKAANPNSSFDFVDDVEDQTSTWWRFRALKHATHDFILFRDCDSRLSDREIYAVEEWLKSPYPYHAMRDHQFHGRQLLAGLWGIKRGAYGAHYQIPDQIRGSGDWYGVDQVELLTWVWTICRRIIMTHIGCYHIYERIEQRRPFIVPRSKAVPFVAQGFDAYDNPRYPEHIDKIDTDQELLDRDDIFKEEFRVPRKMSSVIL